MVLSEDNLGLAVTVMTIREFLSAARSGIGDQWNGKLP
jgi:hypothetical protein